jgi:O-antigen ligase
MRLVHSHRRSGRTLLAVLLYLVAFGLLLSIVSHYYLIPALIAKHSATPDQKRLLAASSRLIMALLLFVLLMGLLLTFRIGRFFFPRRRDPVKPTEYVDAWEEAGRRMKVPEDEQQEEEDAL